MKKDGMEKDITKMVLLNLKLKMEMEKEKYMIIMVN